MAERKEKNFAIDRRSGRTFEHNCLGGDLALRSLTALLGDNAWGGVMMAIALYPIYLKLKSPFRAHGMLTADLITA
ncbi:MAG: hypothetical protein GDA41_00840 [Rhodospirillales bacterium]|nr:hypothetical protein [Rhodospirillales bacterium]